MGLAVVMALALTVSVGATSASASGFETYNPNTEQPDYPAYVDGAAALQEFYLGPWASFQCWTDFDTSELTGPGRLLTTSMACEKNAKLKSFSANGCEFTFRSGAEVAEGQFAGTFSIGGAKCTAIAIETASPTCKFSIPPQSGVTGVTFESAGGSPETAQISVETATLTYISETGGECGSKGLHSKSGIWNGGWKVGAEGHTQVPVDLKTVASIGTGISVAEGQFQAETYPQSVDGDQISTMTLLGASGMTAVSCSSWSYQSQLTAASSGMAIDSNPQGCTDTLGRKVTVQTNGCAFEANASGSAGFCSEGAKGIEFLTYNGSGKVVCTLTVVPQSGLSGLSYTNVGSGDEAGIQVGASVKSIQTTTSGGLLNCGTTNGSHSNGSYEGNFELFGMGS